MPDAKSAIWFRLAEALNTRPGEDLQTAALRALRRGTPNWAAARVVLRAHASQLRGDDAWSALHRAVSLLPPTSGGGA